MDELDFGENRAKNSVPVTPHIAANKRVQTGVPKPNSRPNNPISMRMGKTIKALESHGNTLRAAPFFIGALL